MKTFFAPFLFFSLIANVAMTQVGINADGAATDGSAMLDVNSANRGVLLPRMNYSQLMGIVNPAEGLIVFCTDFRCGASGNKTTG